MNATRKMAGRILGVGDYTKERYSCEYLVVGTGAGGSVAGALLSRAGKDVILLEEGGYHPPESATSNISNMMSLLYRNRGIVPFLGSPTIPFAEACCVGGGTVINGALLWRTPPWILDDWYHRLRVRGYTNNELECHFNTIEQDLNVVTHNVETDANLDSMYLLAGSKNLGWRTAMAPRAVTECKNINQCATGCPQCHKQSTLENYIPESLNCGARLFSNCRAKRIIHSGGVARKLVAQITESCETQTIEIEFSHLVLAAGAIQTPHLLRRSKLARRAGRDLQFHMNLKFVALFRDDLWADRGTIFTVQVQEFARQGLLIMASNLQPHYVSTTLAHHGNQAIDHVLHNYSKSAIYVAMIRSESKAHISNGFGDNPIIWYRFDSSDLIKAQHALHRTAELLFQSGAVELYLPISGSGPMRSLSDVDRVVRKVEAKNLEMISVHAMASCPMGLDPHNSVVGMDGRLWGINNVLLVDASVLPSSIGESPQGTIMAFAHEIIGKHLAESPR